MKKLLYVLFILPFLFVDCTNDSMEIADTSTADLLETLAFGGDDYTVWCMICSDLYLPGVTRFNDKLRTDELAIALFDRSDCFSVLESKYRIIVAEKQEHSLHTAYFEMLLASDICMSVLNKKEKIRLMELALEKTAYEKVQVREACHIMIAVMQSCNYAPFVEEIQPQLRETLNGYTLSAPDDPVQVIGLDTEAADRIIAKARQFLNKQ